MNTRVQNYPIYFLLMVLPLIFSPLVEAQGKNQITRAESPSIKKITLTSLDVRMQSGDFEQWGDAWNDTSPVPLVFRWKTTYSNVGSAIWKVYDDSGRLVSKGDAGKIATGNQIYRQFSINFVDIVGSNVTRPLNYSVVVANVAAKKAAAASGSLSKVKPNTGISAQALKREISAHSKPVLVTIGQPGEGTRFTDEGLNPQLLESMSIGIDLERLDIYGKGGDEDPYLFIAAIFADGTTITPVVGGTKASIMFPNSSVRVATAPRTHENVAGGDPGDKISIPRDTGHFETTIRPIGLALARSSGATSAELRELRENTNVALLVIGMEEDAVPSTSVVNQSRDLFIRRLTEELNAIVQGLSLPIKGSSIEFPDLQGLLGDLRTRLRNEIKGFAKAEGVDELGTLLGIHAWPMIISLGGGNADDYIGQDQVTFSYQDILDAGTNGISFELRLDQNCKCGKPRYIQSQRTEEIMYEIQGRIRRTQ